VFYLIKLFASGVRVCREEEKVVFAVGKSQRARALSFSLFGLCFFSAAMMD
jgi:hypothetical protein